MRIFRKTLNTLLSGLSKKRYRLRRLSSAVIDLVYAGIVIVGGIGELVRPQKKQKPVSASSETPKNPQSVRPERRYTILPPKNQTSERSGLKLVRTDGKPQPRRGYKK